MNNTPKKQTLILTTKTMKELTINNMLNDYDDNE